MRRLLIADDSSTIRRVVAHAFAGTDIDVITVESGRAAVDAARRDRPDIVLCDVLMPEMSGYEVLESLKSEQTTADVPVLLLTGAYEPFDEERASRAGAVGFLAKPFETRLLMQRVEEVLARLPARESEPGVFLAPPIEPRAQTASLETGSGDDPLGALSEAPATWKSTPNRVPLPGDEDFRLAPPAATPVIPTPASPLAVPSAAFDEAWRAEVLRVIEAIAPDIIREIAWEVVPDLLERLLREAVPPPPAASAKGSGERS
ncbi:MAG: response regulator [Acidobacteriota bacterium]